MRHAAILLLLIAGCVQTIPQDHAGDGPAPEAAPVSITLNGCLVAAGLFTLPEPVAEGFLPAGFRLAPHPQGIGAALAGVGVACDEARGTALNQTLQGTRESMGFLWVVPPEALGGADLHLLPIGAEVPSPELHAVYEQHGFATHYNGPAALDIMEDPVRVVTVESGAPAMGMTMRIAAPDDGTVRPQVHRVFAVDGAVNGYVDVTLPGASTWSGPATLNAGPGMGTGVVFQQPGVGQVWDVRGGNITYTFIDLR